MLNYDIYTDIALRTNGDIYIGVVGPVRTGKSTFVAKVVENLILPSIKNKNARQRTLDELPQSADGTTIMTTQPKFVPNEAAKLVFADNVEASVRLIDCVGYLVDGATGDTEQGKKRQVKTPWSNQEMPFAQAAELGTFKVVTEHSTIAVVMTSDGSITELPRANYVSAEERVVRELKAYNKPFVIILNSKNPQSMETIALKDKLEEKYDNKVCAVDVKNMTGKEMEEILTNILLEFPVKCINFDMPQWLQVMDSDNWIVQDMIREVTQNCNEIHKMKDANKLAALFENHPHLLPPVVQSAKMGNGCLHCLIQPKPHLFFKLLSEKANAEIADDFALMSYISEVSHAKREYDRISQALIDVNINGYGMVSPSLDEMTLENPEIIKQGNRYGVKLKASAPSLHIMKVDVSTEVSPMVGTEQQSQYLLSEFQSNPQGIWETNMFGKTMSQLAREGLSNKLGAMPNEAQDKIRRTVTRVVNENRGGLICILL